MSEESPIYGPASRALGEERFHDLMQHFGTLQAQLQFLNLSVAITAGRREFSDEQLDCLIQDARDVKAAAATLGNFAIDLAEKWRAQRQELEP